MNCRISKGKDYRRKEKLNFILSLFKNYCYYNVLEFNRKDVFIRITRLRSLLLEQVILHPLHVLAGAGIYLYRLTFINKERNLDDKSCLQRGWLGGARSCVPPDARVCLCDH